MMYLEYLLLLIIIILVYILYDKINDNKEGFEHIGNGFIAAKPKKKEANVDGKTDTREEEIIIAAQTTYNVAEMFAQLLIQKPWQIISQGVNTLIEFVKNINEMLKPIWDFIQQMFNILKKIVNQIYGQFAKAFKQGFAILRNLPAFMKKYANMAINFINKMINQLIQILEQFIDVVKTVGNAIIELPSMFFNIMSQAVTFGLTAFTMAMKIPEFLLKFGINIQDKMMDFMDKQ